MRHLTAIRRVRDAIRPSPPQRRRGGSRATMLAEDFEPVPVMQHHPEPPVPKALMRNGLHLAPRHARAESNTRATIPTHDTRGHRGSGSNSASLVVAFVVLVTLACIVRLLVEVF